MAPAIEKIRALIALEQGKTSPEAFVYGIDAYLPTPRDIAMKDGKTTIPIISVHPKKNLLTRPKREKRASIQIKDFKLLRWAINLGLLRSDIP
jgi:hypothetical protein